MEMVPHFLLWGVLGCLNEKGHPSASIELELLEKSAKQKNSIFVFHDLHFMSITLYYFSFKGEKQSFMRTVIQNGKSIEETCMKNLMWSAGQSAAYLCMSEDNLNGKTLDSKVGFDRNNLLSCGIDRVIVAGKTAWYAAGPEKIGHYGRYIAVN